MKNHAIPVGKAQRGSAMVEMSLIIIPMLLLMLGIMEACRCIWTYHTLSSVTYRAARYAVVHGAGCVAASDACLATVADVATLIARQGIGLDGSALTLTLKAGSSERTCTTLSACLADHSQWPPSSNNTAGLPVTVGASYTFPTAVGMVLPSQTGALRLAAKATEVIQF